MRQILVYRDKLLAGSETFVVGQGEGLSGYRPFYFGARGIPGIELPAQRRYCINDGGPLGRCREVAFKALGWLKPAEAALVRELKPVLVHAHFGPDGVLALQLAKRARAPLLVTFHGFDATTRDDYARRCDYLHRNYLKKRGVLFRECSRIIAVSHFVKRKLLEQGAPEQKIVVHYTGVDLTRFRPEPEVRREPIVLFVGRLVEVKGCRHLLRAMELVQRSFPEAELVVIGDGPLRGELEAQAGRSLHRCRFLGSQPPHLVRAWLNRATLLSVTSVTLENGNAEAFGTVFVEAQAMGLPVVSFDSGGIAEAVAHAETGLLFPEGDWEGIASGICRLLSDTALWRLMSGSGQARVRERFDLQTQTRRLEGIYAEAIDEFSRGVRQ